MPLPPGALIGPYTILRALGVGGMGETYVAEAAGATGCVCLKIVRRDLADDPRFVALFRDEVRLHAHLHHKNIVRVLDVGEEQSGSYSAMELIEGASLERLLRFVRARQEHIPVRVCAFILRELCRALDHAHNLEIEGARQQLVHRDLSPSNVILSTQGEVKLTDFGIAKSRARTHQTTAGVVRGKLAYMAPEQIRAEALDGRCDLFALGILAYELFAGVHPFLADADESSGDLLVVHHILSNERTSLLERTPWLPGAFIDLTECLLATDRAGRPQTAAEVELLLNAYGIEDTASEELGTLIQRIHEEDDATSEAPASGPRRSLDADDSHFVQTPTSDNALRFEPRRGQHAHAAASASPRAQGSVRPIALAETQAVMVPVQIIRSDAHHVVAAWRNCAVLIWLRDTRASEIRSAWDALQRLAIEYPAGVGLLQIIEKDCNGLDNEARQTLSELYRSGMPIRCSAIVMEGSGFRAASARMIVAAIARSAAQHVPLRMFSSVDAAVTWESEYFAPPIARADWASEFAKGVGRLRQTDHG